MHSLVAASALDIQPPVRSFCRLPKPEPLHVPASPSRLCSSQNKLHTLLCLQAAIFDRIKVLSSQMRSVRCSGACAMNLCNVAAGKLDVMYEIGFGGCWDVAAGAVIVEEAGGQVLDPTGGPFDVMGRRVLAANRHLGLPAAAILKQCKPSSKEPLPQR